MELVGELKSTSLFEPVDHSLFQIHGMRLLMDQTFAQISRIKLLEDILVVQVLEDSDAVVEFVIDLIFTDAFLRFFQQVITILGQLESRKIMLKR